MVHFACFRDGKLIGRSYDVYPAWTEQVGDSDLHFAYWPWHRGLCYFCTHSQPHSDTIDSWRFWRVLWFRPLDQYCRAHIVRKMTANKVMDTEMFKSSRQSVEDACFIDIGLHCF